MQMFRYRGGNSVPELLTFAVDGYLQGLAEDVPPPPSLATELWGKLSELVDRARKAVSALYMSC